MSTSSIVVLHGALGSAAQMHPIAEALRTLRVERDAVHCIELPGHGARGLPSDTPFTMQTFAQTLRDEIEARGLSRPVVFGYSMGGYAALLLEAMSPGALGGIVTLGTKFEWTADVAAAAASRLDAAVLSAKVPAFAEQLRARHEGAGGWELLLARTAQLLIGLGSEPLLTTSTLAAIAIPVRIAVGARDDTVTALEAERTALLLPQATAHVLHDVPHPIERVPANLVVDLVADLLRDLPRS